MFTLSFKTGNAAFEGADLGPEVALILRALADRVEDMSAEELPLDLNIYDSNGNRVGAATIKES